MRPLYIAATGQHVGKTTSTLGLVTVMKKKGYNVGYCKPVGQKHLNLNGEIVDKDVVLFAEILNFEIKAAWHSPVVIGSGVTKEYIDNPDDFDFHQNILDSYEYLKGQHDLVVFEGTGHPGVGSVADVSNADVALLLKAGVVMVVEGGIGNTLDRLSLSIARFQSYNIPIWGIIVNKVFPEKLEQVKYYVGKKLEQQGLDLLGVVPFDKRLSFPIMETIRDAVKGKVLFNDDQLANQVEDIIAGSLVHTEELPAIQNMLLVVSVKRLEEALKKLEHITSSKKLETFPISGIILTGDGLHEQEYNVSEYVQDVINKHQIPVITTKLDTYGSAVKISQIEVKINTRTPWKTMRAIQLIRENVDIDLIIEKLKE